MSSNSAKDLIRQRIEQITNTPYPHLITSETIEHIAGLRGNKQFRAVLQEALMQLKYANVNISLQECLAKQVSEISLEIYQEEVKLSEEKKEWSDKYADLQYVKKGDKVKAKLDGEDLALPEIACTCDDGKIYPDLGNAYPCSCPLGDKWAKGTGYTGPFLLPEAKKESQTAKGIQDIQNQWEDGGFGLVSKMSGMLGGLAGSGAAQVTIQTKPFIVPKPAEVKVTPVKRIEIEEPVGRKFKNI